MSELITIVISSLISSILTIIILKIIYKCVLERGLNKYVLKMIKIEEILKKEWGYVGADCGGDFDKSECPSKCEFIRVCRHRQKMSELIKELGNICY
jgi:hypothetical protein